MANVIIKIISDVSSLVSGTKASADRMVALRGEILKVEAELKKLKGGTGGVIDVKSLTETENKLKSLRSEFGAAQKGQASFAGGSSAVASGLLKGAGVIGLAVGAFSGLKSIVSSSVKAFGESEAAQKSLEVALGGTSKALNEQAEQIQKTTLFQDDAVTAAQATLAQYKLTEDQIQKLIPSLADFAQAQGIDIAEAAAIAAKSIQGGANTLGRYGVALEGAAGTSKRLESAIDGLNSKFADQAKGAAEVGTGPLKQLSNQFNDLEETVGGLIVNFTGPFISAVSSVIGELSDALKPVDSTEEFKAQLDSVIELEDGVRPLIDRYNELSTQTELTAEQTKELSSVTQQIAGIIPVAATGFDAYGKAVGISADAVDRYLKGQRLLLQEKNQDAIREQATELAKATVAQVEANQKLNGTYEGLFVQYKKVGDQLFKITDVAGTKIFTEVSIEQINKLKDEQAKALAERRNSIDELGKLTGDFEEKRRQEQKRAVDLDNERAVVSKKSSAVIVAGLKEQGIAVENIDEELNALNKQRKEIVLQIKGAEKAGEDVTQLKDQLDLLDGKIVNVTVSAEVLTSREGLQAEVDAAAKRIEDAKKQGASTEVLKKQYDALGKAQTALTEASTAEGIERDIAIGKIDDETESRKKLIDAVESQSKAVQLAKAQYELEIAIIKDFEQKKIISVTEAQEQILKQTEVLSQKRLDAARTLATADGGVSEAEKQRIIVLEENLAKAQQATEAFKVQAHAVDQVAESTKLLNAQQAKTNFEGIRIEVDQDFAANIESEIAKITADINASQEQIQLGVDVDGVLQSQQDINKVLLSRLGILKDNQQREIALAQFAKDVVGAKRNEVELDQQRLKSLEELAVKEQEVNDQVTSGTISQEEAQTRMASIKQASVTLGVQEGETIKQATEAAQEKLVVDQNALDSANDLLRLKRLLVDVEDEIVSAGKRTLDQSIQQKALEELASGTGPVARAAQEQLVVLKPQFDLDNLSSELEATKKKLDLLTTEKAREEQILLSATTEEEQKKAQEALDETEKAIEEVTKTAVEQQQVLFKAATVGKSPLARMFAISDEEAQQIKDANREAALDIVNSISSAIQQGQAEANARRLDQSLSSIDERSDAELAKEQESLDKGVITQEGFENRRKSIEEKAEKDRTTAKKKAFEQDKKLKLAQATIEFGIQLIRINAANAGIPIVGPALSAAQAIAAGVAYAANVILISSTKFKKGGRVPSFSEGNLIDSSTISGASGGHVAGPAHEQGGVPFAVKGVPMEMEGGEFVVQKKAVEHYGVDFISKVNKMMLPAPEKKFKTGGWVPEFATGGAVPSDVSQFIANNFNGTSTAEKQITRESNDESIASLHTKADKNQTIVVEVETVTRKQNDLARSRQRMTY